MKEQNTAENIDAVDAFKQTHTSKKKGLTGAAREAIYAIESMMAEPVADGEQARSSADVVSKVLSQDSSNNTFLKNAGIPTTTSRSSDSSTEKALQEELEAEKQGSVALRDEVDVLKQKTERAEEALAKTQQDFESFRQHQEENNLLLRRILNLSQGNSSQS
ncbi:hypothetical protein ACP4OV_030771 [Aristida adscensionis]